MMRLRSALPLLLTLLLTGCGLLSTTTQTATQVAPVSATTLVSGSVQGGNQPVVGATIQLWQMGTSGYGSTPSPLGSPAITGVGGNYSITGNYSCSNASAGVNSFVYVTATGGNPGLGAGTNNDALSLVTVLGLCGSLTPTTFVTINEATTVAAVYALQPYMNASGGIGAYGAQYQGLYNAIVNANTLVSTTTGFPQTTFHNNATSFPVATLNTLANILVPCVNSANSSSPACVSLFAAATPAGGTPPANTLVAMLDIARNPAQPSNPSYVSNLFNLTAANPAFQPMLTAAPNDWTVSIGYSTGVPPTSIAIDANGNIWTVGVAGNSKSYLTYMLPRGGPATNSPYTDANLSGAYGLAIDTQGSVYVSNSTNNTFTEYNLDNTNAIQPIASPFNNIGLNSPKGMMIDSSHNLWIANSGSNSVTEFSLDTSNVAQYSGGGLSAPTSIAGDLNGNIWIANSTGGSITSIPQYGSSNAGYGSHTGGGLGSSPSSLSIDAGGNVWVSDAVASDIALFGTSGTPVSSSIGYTGGGLSGSYANAIDGAGNLWVADTTGNRLTELSPAGAAITPTTGYQGGLGSPKSIAIDLSGDIWVGNTSPVNGAAVTQFVGLAAPANAPLQAGLTSGGVGTTPGTLNFNGGFVSSGELGVAYTTQFTASGALNSYAWSITSGLSALQAIGLSFSTSGVLSGTPTATGSYTFTVQVRDIYLNNTTSKSFTLTVTTPPGTSCTQDGTGNAILNGHYAFLLSGFDPNGHYYDQIGSFKADGAGNLTSGLSDVNGDRNLSVFNSGSLFYTFAGTYSIGSTDNRGMLTFNNANGTGTGGLPTSTSYCFAADTVTGGVANSGRLIQADGSGYVLTGSFQIENSGTFTAASLTGGYVLGVQGVTGTTTTRAALAGQFTTNGAGGITSGQVDTSATTTSNGTTFVNTYTAGNPLTVTGGSSSYTMGSLGRGSVTLTFNGLNVPFIAYITGSGQQLFLMSQFAGQNGNPLFIGKALLQTTTNFTTANVAGSGVFRANGVSNPNSTPIYDAMEVGQLTFDGAGNGTFTADANSGGNSITTPSTNSLTGSYIVSPNGYVQITSGSHPPNFYLYAPGGGFGIDSNIGVGFYYMLPQTIPSGGFTNANLSSSLSGSYGIGTVSPSAYNINPVLLNNGTQYPILFEGTANFSSGNYSIIQDTVAAPGTGGSGFIATNYVSSGSYFLDPTYGQNSGRFVIQNTGQTVVVGYVISPTQAFALTVSSGQNPSLVEADHK